MRVVMGLSLTATSAVWALVDTKDGAILADEVVALDSVNEIARATARSVQAFALQSDRDIDGIRMTWTDDGRGNVALTVAFPSPVPLAPITLLPLRVGTVVIDALNDSRLSLKWPNDVLLEGGKVAGILVESNGDAIFVGIGVNVASAPAVPSAGPDRGRRAAKIPGDAVAIAQSIADGLGIWSESVDDAARVITDWSARADWAADLELRETGELVKPVRLLPDGRLRVRGAGGERALVADYLL